MLPCHRGASHPPCVLWETWSSREGRSLCNENKQGDSSEYYNLIYARQIQWVTTMLFGTNEYFQRVVGGGRGRGSRSGSHKGHVSHMKDMVLTGLCLILTTCVWSEGHAPDLKDLQLIWRTLSHLKDLCLIWRNCVWPTGPASHLKDLYLTSWSCVWSEGPVSDLKDMHLTWRTCSSSERTVSHLIELSYLKDLCLIWRIHVWCDGPMSQLKD